MSEALNNLDGSPCHPVGTLSDKVERAQEELFFYSATLSAPLRGAEHKGRERGTVRQPDKVEPKKWDVRRTDPVFGVREKLGTVKAGHLVEAQILADLEFKARLEKGQQLLVSPAGGGRRRPPRRKP